VTSVNADRYQLADRNVSRIGYGAMQLAGDGVFGPPRDRDEALAVLRAAVESEVDHIDTAHFYGPGVVNELIREALYPYPDGLALVTKVAARRDDSGAVLPYDEPHQLRAGIEDNLRALGIEQLTAVNLRLMDNAVPDNRFVDQLGAMIQARDEGLIAGIGLSNIRLAHLCAHWSSPKSYVCKTFSTLPTASHCRSFMNASLARSPSCRSARSGGRVGNTSRFGQTQ
jgi:pyridoxine 4-dehydrogenase